MSNTLKNVVALTFIVLFACTMYAMTLRGLPGNPTPATAESLEGETNPFELSPERGRFAHVMALGDTGKYELSQQLADFAYPDVGYYNGKFYGFFAPGIAYMALPFYEAGKSYGMSQVFTFGFVSVMSVLALVFLYLIGREVLGLPVWAAMLACIIFAFGSTAWSYAITLYQHHVTTFFALSAFYAAWRFKGGGRWSGLWGLLVWAWYALAITIDYPNAFLLLPVMVYFLLVSLHTENTARGFRLSLRPAALVTMAAFIVITGVHLAFNATHFGGWQQVAGGLTSYRSILEQGLLGHANPETAIAARTTKQDVVQFFHEENFPEGISVLFFSSDRGLFFYGPIFILAIFGAWQLARRKGNLEVWSLIGLVLANIFLYASWGDPWGGWAYGTRYMTLTMSILSLFVVAWLAAEPQRIWKNILALTLFMYSSAIALLGALTTNAIPPHSEAIGLSTGWNFMRNWTFFKNGQSGSFFYRSFVAEHMPLADYFVLIYAAVVCVAFTLLFIVPLFEHRHED
ncbi:MAG: hypothetical protein RL681_866 [Candidatus Parcubacteria bacterium]|jgi:hypothetical protein